MRYSSWFGAQRRVFGRGSAWTLTAAVWLCLMAGLAACAGAPPPTTQATAGLGATAPPTASPALINPTEASPTGVAPPPPGVSATTTAAPSATSPLAPLQALQHNLGAADQEMSAAQTSSNLEDARQHAQAVVDIYVGYWGRWYATSEVSNASLLAGIFPGEKLPGPPPDGSTATLPIGLGVKLFDQGDPAAQQAAQTIMGDVAAWKTAPATQYDRMAAAVAGTDLTHNLVGKLAGRGPRAVAWARLILTKAATVDEARQYAALGQPETRAALAAVAQ